MSEVTLFTGDDAKDQCAMAFVTDERRMHSHNGTWGLAKTGYAFSRALDVKSYTKAESQKIVNEVAGKLFAEKQEAAEEAAD